MIKIKSTKEYQKKVILLYKHGKEVFGDKGLFMKWLNEENYYFNNKPPIDFINTLEGIKFIDNQLTGMQYGDNA